MVEKIVLEDVEKETEIEKKGSSNSNKKLNSLRNAVTKEVSDSLTDEEIGENGTIYQSIINWLNS